MSIRRGHVLRWGGRQSVIDCVLMVVIKDFVQYVESAVPLAPIDSFYVFYCISVYRRFRLRRLGVATCFHRQC